MKLILIILCGVLWEVGGRAKEDNPFSGMDKKIIRTMILPGVLCLWFFPAHPVLSVLSFGCMQIFRIGYGESSFLGKIYSTPWVTRMMAGILYGAIGGAALLFGSHHYEAWLSYIGIIAAVNATLCYLGASKKVMEVGAGLSAGSILWLI